MKLLPFLILVLLLALGSPLASAQTPIQTQDIGVTKSVSAPAWHTGQQWRVQVPLLQGRPDKPGSLRDSDTDFLIYRFQVLGQRTLRYEEQDGKKHIGQSVPPEDCWLVSVTPDRLKEAFRSYHLYFRTDDLSLREIYQVPYRGRGGDFLYSGTRVNDDDEAKSIVEVHRAPFRTSLESLVLDWPRFPLTVGGVAAKKTSDNPITQAVAADALGVRVVLSDGRQTTAQTWCPGDPWWCFAERDGLQKSRLLPDK